MKRENRECSDKMWVTVWYIKKVKRNSEFLDHNKTENHGVGFYSKEENHEDYDSESSIR